MNKAAPNERSRPLEKDYINFLKPSRKPLMEKVGEFSEFFRARIDREHFHYQRIAIEGTLPKRKVVDAYSGNVRQMYYLASNDYLNLSSHPEVVEAGIEAMRRFGAGAGSVPLLGGTTSLHVELAAQIAAFKGCESAILFTSGFGANAGTLSALLGKHDLAVVDALAHASIQDGCANTNKRLFKHNDMESLERVLKESAGHFANVMIVIDGVYSMDGDIAMLDQIHAIAKRYNALLFVDEAHATGVIGPEGRGTPAQFGLSGKVDLVSGTFSKAMGGVGGYVATSKAMTNYLYFMARNYVFSTAMSPQIAGSMLKSLDIIQHDTALRARLWENIAFFKSGLQSLGFDMSTCETAIFPIVLGNEDTVQEATRQLQNLDIYVNPVVFPAVSVDASRLRFSLMASFTQADLAEVLCRLETVGKRLHFLPRAII